MFKPRDIRKFTQSKGVFHLVALTTSVTCHYLICEHLAGHIRQMWCLLSGVNINSEPTSFMFICITHSVFICPKQPVYFTVHLVVSQRKQRHTLELCVCSIQDDSQFIKGKVHFPCSSSFQFTAHKHPDSMVSSIERCCSQIDKQE